MRVLALASLPWLLGAQAPGETVTTQQDQQALAVTIYNDNLALVRDQREVKLPEGDLDLAFQEVSAQIRPETALLRNLTDPKEFWINEQNFDFDLLTPQKLLEKYVGAQGHGGAPGPTPTAPAPGRCGEEAEVLATNGGVVLKFADRIETAPPGRIVFPGVPGQPAGPAHPGAGPPLRRRAGPEAGAHLPHRRPVLAGRLRGQPGPRTRRPWTWPAGSPSPTRAAPPTRRPPCSWWPGTCTGPEPRGARRTACRRMAHGHGQRPADEGGEPVRYHLYTLDRPTTLKENQTKQVALLTAQAVPVRKEYVLKGDSLLLPGPLRRPGRQAQGGRVRGVRQPRRGPPGHAPAQGRRAGLQARQRRPAPVRGRGRHRPHPRRTRQVRLKLGDAFDVTARRRQTDFKALGAQGQSRTCTSPPSRWTSRTPRRSR